MDAYKHFVFCEGGTLSGSTSGKDYPMQLLPLHMRCVVGSNIKLKQEVPMERPNGSRVTLAPNSPFNVKLLPFVVPATALEPLKLYMGTWKAGAGRDYEGRLLKGSNKDCTRNDETVTAALTEEHGVNATVTLTFATDAAKKLTVCQKVMAELQCRCEALIPDQRTRKSFVEALEACLGYLKRQAQNPMTAELAESLAHRTIPIIRMTLFQLKMIIDDSDANVGLGFDYQGCKYSDADLSIYVGKLLAGGDGTGNVTYHSARIHDLSVFVRALAGQQKVEQLRGPCEGESILSAFMCTVAPFAEYVLAPIVAMFPFGLSAILFARGMYKIVCSLTQQEEDSKRLLEEVVKYVPLLATAQANGITERELVPFVVALEKELFNAYESLRRFHTHNSITAKLRYDSQWLQSVIALIQTAASQLAHSKIIISELPSVAKMEAIAEEKQAEVRALIDKLDQRICEVYEAQSSSFAAVQTTQQETQTFLDTKAKELDAVIRRTMEDKIRDLQEALAIMIDTKMNGVAVVDTASDVSTVAQIVTNALRSVDARDSLRYFGACSQQIESYKQAPSAVDEESLREHLSTFTDDLEASYTKCTLNAKDEIFRFVARNAEFIAAKLDAHAAQVEEYHRENQLHAQRHTIMVEATHDVVLSQSEQLSQLTRMVQLLLRYHNARHGRVVGRSPQMKLRRGQQRRASPLFRDPSQPSMQSEGTQPHYDSDCEGDEQIAAHLISSLPKEAVDALFAAFMSTHDRLLLLQEMLFGKKAVVWMPAFRFASQDGLGCLECSLDVILDSEENVWLSAVDRLVRHSSEISPALCTAECQTLPTRDGKPVVAVVGVDLRYCWGKQRIRTDDLCAFLQSIPGPLHYFNATVYNPRRDSISDKTLRTLLPKAGEWLRELYLRGSASVTEKTLSSIPEYCPNITHLDLSLCFDLEKRREALNEIVTSLSATLVHLALERMHVGGIFVSDGGVMLPCLESLVLNESPDCNVTLLKQVTRQCPELQLLHVSRCDVTVSQVADVLINFNQQITSLDIGWLGCLNENTATLLAPYLKSLTYLSMEGTKCATPGALHTLLRGLASLRYLNISYLTLVMPRCPHAAFTVTGDFVAALGNSAIELRTLILNGVRMDLAPKGGPVTLTSLSELHVRGNEDNRAISVEALQSFVSHVCPSLVAVICDESKKSALRPALRDNVLVECLPTLPGLISYSGW